VVNENLRRHKRALHEKLNNLSGIMCALFLRFGELNFIPGKLNAHSGNGNEKSYKFISPSISSIDILGD